MRSSKHISVFFVTILAAVSFTPCFAQTVQSGSSGDAVLVKPRENNNYNSSRPADAAVNRFMDKLTGKVKKQASQRQAWDERIDEIKQVLNAFPLSITRDGYYSGWHGDYSNCVYAKIDKIGPRHIDWNLASGDYGLSPDDANTLPPTNVVSECLAIVKAKYEQNQRERVSEKARQDRSTSCQASPKGQLAQLSAEIVHARSVVGFAQANLDQEKKVEAVSGTIDLETAHKMGEIIVYGQQEIDSDFKQYRQLGGNATSAADVVQLDNPCKALR